MAANISHRKILMVVPELDFGGVESGLRDRAIGLREAGYEIELACFHKLGKAGKKLQEMNFSVHNLEMSPRVPNFKLILKLIKLFRELKPDIIHAACFEANFHCLVASRLAGGGAAVIVEEVGILSDERGKPIRSLKARKVGRFVWNRADGILVIAQAVKKSIIELEGAPAERIAVIPYHIDLNRFNFAAKIANRTRKTEFVIGCVARLSREKGQRILLPAFKSALQKNENLKLWLIGDGPDRDNLINIAQELGIAEKVKFWGARTDIPELLAQMDLYVLASYWEGLPIAVLEAIASGTPVIASSVGGVPEVIEHNVNGYLFSVGDVDALAEEIIRAINLDDAKRLEIVTKGRETAELHFSESKVIGQISELYAETLANRKER